MAATALLMSTTAFAQGNCCPEVYTPQCCETNCCGNFFVSAELLYWRAFEGGLANPCEGIEINTIVDQGVTFSILNGTSHFPNSEWNPGFRFGVGYQFGDRDCDLAVYWTYYKSDTRGGNDLNLYKWNLDYNVVDAFYSCDFNCSSCFGFSPYFGLRYAQIDQCINKEFITTIDSVQQLTSTRIKQDFWGVGPVFGVESDLGLGCGFSLYGNAAVGVLFGKYDVNSRREVVLDTVTNIDNLVNDPQASTVVLDLGFGVRWTTCYCDKVVSLQIGVEEHRYFNHNQFCGYGDLSMAGVNVGVGVEF